MMPEEMLALLCAKSPRQKSSLEAVYAICKEIVDAGGTNFTSEHIGRVGATRGGPRAQTIRNKTGDNFKALIKCFKDAPGTRKRAKKTLSSTDWVDGIKDPKIRILVDRTLAELAEARRELNELIPPGTEFRVDDRRGQSSEVVPNFKLNEFEREALTFLLSDSFLLQWRYERGKRGDVLNAKGDTVFQPGTLPALEKALKYL
ncbi:gamma-mobile-trio protein GmtX [Pseudomonas syringae]|uniref:gamma-mobile-trio protein GmtX n=1 Tax=Pseudomonas syringae TaxID=317 RepID=UPI000BB64025|nr:gamma-mobile-trio protein GmtX [Pseudomonas syringae]PBP46175.1 hypothetical protein CCL13_12280 [Pseudomonas syringae]